MSILGAIAGSVVTGLFNRSNARDQMAFQQRNSDTAHQREVKDLRAAGLNPILSAKYGGASTPPGATATMPDLGQSINSAQSVKQQGVLVKSQVIKNEAEASQAHANAAKAIAEKNNIELESNNIGQKFENLQLEGQQISENIVLMQKLGSKHSAEYNKLLAETENIKAQYANTLAMLEEILSRTGLNNAHAKQMQQNIDILQAELAKSKIDYKIWTSNAGELARRVQVFSGAAISPLTGPVSGILRSVK